jgi:AcrR family transcriptional regulator
MSVTEGTTGSGNRRGPKGERGAVADRILRQAREQFARNGYAATTLQGIARAAGVDTKLVRYYFGGKETLLAECLVAPPGLIERVRAIADAPRSERGELLVRTHLAAWADPDLATIMRTSLLIAAHETVAMERVRSVFVDGLLPAIGDAGTPEEARIRSGLICSQLLGLAYARFILTIDQTVAIPGEDLVRLVGANLQRYLDAEVDVEEPPPSPRR